MKHLQTFESFLNEASGLEYWKDYEVDTSPQADKKLAKKCTSMSDAKKCIKDAIEEWDSESEEGDELSNNEIKLVTDFAMKFFNKFGYINGNIVLAMITQEIYII